MTTDSPHTPSNDLTPKQRMAIERQQMPERPGDERRSDFKEVNLGLPEAVAIREAQRCLQCRQHPCVKGCPVGVDIPRFLAKIAEGDFLAAAAIIRRDNTLPAVTGRVCPQETQCEAQCVRCKTDAPLAIGWLERFVADYEQQHGSDTGTATDATGSTGTAGTAGATEATGTAVGKTSARKTGKKVACIGSGPAGITCAGELARHGHDVTIFEAFHKPGGVLVYGIPEFRLPNMVVQQELERLVAMGVTIETNVIIGRTLTIKQLFEQEGFDAVFLANGAGLPVFMHLPGENLKGVYSANEYLTRVNLMEAYRFPEVDTPVIRGSGVCVVGGGNVAMDAVRTSLRLGAAESTIVYRRAREQMPARVEEVHHAEQEGVRFELLTNPIEVLGTPEGWVKGLRCIRMELGEPDASGRRRPVPIEGSEFEIPCDLFVVAVGTRANPLITATTPELTINKWGYVEVDDQLMTSIPGLFAGGDIVRGAATVILAMGDGKQAAQGIHNYLSS